MAEIIYICGPMSGYPERNFPAFAKATELFRSLGFIVVSPVEIGEELCGNDSSIKPAVFLRADIRKLLECDSIALLPAWEYSVGASCEVAVGISISLDFYNAITGYSILRPPQVIITRGY